MSTSLTAAEMVDDAAELLDGHLDDLVAFLDDVATLGQAAAPAPGAELARLLVGTPVARAASQLRTDRRPVASGRGRLSRRAAGLAAAAVAGLSVTGAGALANELPAPLQRAVAHFSEAYLPFAFPRPVGDPPLLDPSDPGTAAAPARVRHHDAADPDQVGSAHHPGPRVSGTDPGTGTGTRRVAPHPGTGPRPTATSRAVSGGSAPAPAADGGRSDGRPSGTRTLSGSTSSDHQAQANGGDAGPSSAIPTPAKTPRGHALAGTGTPATPDPAAKPETPGKPEATGNQVTPGKPEATGNQVTPGTPEATGKPETVGNPESSGEPGTTDGAVPAQP